MSAPVITIQTTSSTPNVTEFSSIDRIRIHAAFETWIGDLPRSSGEMIKKVLIAPEYRHGQDCFRIFVDIGEIDFDIYVPVHTTSNKKEFTKAVHAELKQKLLDCLEKLRKSAENKEDELSQMIARLA